MDVTEIVDRQQASVFGVEQEEQPVEENQGCLSHFLQARA